MGCLRLAAGLLALIAAAIAYPVFIAGPDLKASSRGDGVHLEGRFLGEYALGFERFEIRDGISGNLLCKLAGSFPSDVDLRPGLNTPLSMFGADARVDSHPGTVAECHLAAGHRYKITAWGNNGCGFVLPSSISVQF